mmetsp:Transcript_19501/g.45357  ORF Transcript_19501/g.45357 Transcript_19501/m.45357 type:complete len:109 (+) Transcript_19501:632-958(+)
MWAWLWVLPYRGSILGSVPSEKKYCRYVLNPAPDQTLPDPQNGASFAGEENMSKVSRNNTVLVHRGDEATTSTQSYWCGLRTIAQRGQAGWFAGKTGQVRALLLQQYL